MTPIRYGTQFALVAGIAWLTAGPSAQGLGEVARKEAARRQQVAAGKKYTNEDLRADEVSAAAPAPATPPAATADAPAEKTDKKDLAADATTAKGEPAITPAREKRDEKYWRDRSTMLRGKLNDSQEKVKAIQQRLAQFEDALARGAGSAHSQEHAVTLKALSNAQTDSGYLK